MSFSRNLLSVLEFCSSETIFDLTGGMASPDPTPRHPGLSLSGCAGPEQSPASNQQVHQQHVGCPVIPFQAPGPMTFLGQAPCPHMPCIQSPVAPCGVGHPSHAHPHPQAMCWAPPPPMLGTACFPMQGIGISQWNQAPTEQHWEGSYDTGTARGREHWAGTATGQNLPHKGKGKTKDKGKGKKKHKGKGKNEGEQGQNSTNSGGNIRGEATNMQNCDWSQLFHEATQSPEGVEAWRKFCKARGLRESDNPSRDHIQDFLSSGGKGEGERKKDGPNQRKLSLLQMNFVDTHFSQEMPDLFPEELRDITITDADASSVTQAGLPRPTVADIEFLTKMPDFFPKEQLQEHMPQDESSVTVTYAELTIPHSHKVEMFHLEADRRFRRLGYLVLMMPKDAQNASEVKIKLLTWFEKDFRDQSNKSIFHAVLGTCRTRIILELLGTKHLKNGGPKPLHLPDGTKVELKLLDWRQDCCQECNQPEKLDARLSDIPLEYLIEGIYKGETLQVEGRARDFEFIASEIATHRQHWIPKMGQKGHKVKWSPAKHARNDWSPGDLFEVRFPELTLMNNLKRKKLHGQLVQLLPSTAHFPFDHPQRALVFPVDIEPRRVLHLSKTLLHPVDCPEEFLEGKYKYRVDVLVPVPRKEGEPDRGTPRLCQNPKFGKGECMVSFTKDGEPKRLKPDWVRYRFPKGARDVYPTDRDDALDAHRVIASTIVSEATGAASSSQPYQAPAAREEQILEDENCDWSQLFHEATQSPEGVEAWRDFCNDRGLRESDNPSRDHIQDFLALRTDEMFADVHGL